MQAKRGFSSIRANNLVFKNKWCYEVRMNTNNLAQIGWCQVTTRFTDHNGIGDDDTSFAFDGYRLVKWPDGKTTYGKFWEIGDVIGCCIDLDEKYIEYFLNGVSLGIAFGDIPVGENIAYFPGVSLSEAEIVTLNFGYSGLQHSYPGYQPFAIPSSAFNGVNNITAQILQLLDTQLLRVIGDKNTNNANKLTLVTRIMEFLANVSFKDEFVIKNQVLEFLQNLSTNKRTQELQLFFEYLLVVVKPEHKKVLVVDLFEALSGSIEECGTSPLGRYKEWKILLELFIDILHIDFVLELWARSNNHAEHLKCVFNTTTENIRELFEFINQENNTGEMTLYAIFKIFRKKYPVAIDEDFDSNKAISRKVFAEGLKHLVLVLLTDTRTIKTDGGTTTMKRLFSDYENMNHSSQQVNSYSYFVQKPVLETAFYKNYVFNLIDIFSQYIQNSFDTFSIEPW